MVIKSNHIALPLFIPDSSNLGNFHWRFDTSTEDSFSFRKVWDFIRTRGSSLNWGNAIWFSGYTPKHAFILWLACWDKLTTRYKLLTWGSITNPACVFCYIACETSEHLFFNCPFTKRIWRHGLHKCQINCELNNIEDTINFISPQPHHGSLKALILKHLLAATVYCFWIERNKRIFNNQPSTKEAIVLEIERHITFKLTFCKQKFNRTSINRNICKVWRLDNLFV